MAVTYTLVSQYDLAARENIEEHGGAVEVLFALLDYLNIELVEVTKADNHCYYTFQKK